MAASSSRRKVSRPCGRRLRSCAGAPPTADNRAPEAMRRGRSSPSFVRVATASDCMRAHVISFSMRNTIRRLRSASMASKVVTLDEAVAHVRAHDAVHIVTNHSRWTAAARHLVRTWWGKDPGWTLVMLSLSSLGALFFKGGLVRKVVTGYSGDVFPNFTPNPWFGDAYLSGRVEVEHWSFLTFLQRLEAAARGVPALVTASLEGSSMA